MTPSQRGLYLENKTIALLATVGYRAERVCRGGGQAGRGGRKDAFGCVDLVAIDIDGTVSLIQVTTKTNASSHRRKIRDAKLNAPVTLFKWEKIKNRWVAFSETIPAFSLSVSDVASMINAERADATNADPLLTEAPL